MKLKELLKIVDYNQKVLINHGPFTEEYRGLRRQINPNDEILMDKDVELVYTDEDIYDPNTLKIRVAKKAGGKHESN